MRKWDVHAGADDARSEKPSSNLDKGGLFLLPGIGASTLLLVETPSLKVGILLGIAVWSFCRAFFAFYVIEKYVDPGFRFSELISLLRYWFRGRNR